MEDNQEMNSADICAGRSDEELVALCIDNKEHLSCIIERYEARLRRYINRITTVSVEDTDDLLQEIFIKVYVNLNGFDDALKFSSWIYRIAHNVVISHYRKISVRPEGHTVAIEDTVLENIAADTSIVDESEKKMLKKHLGEAVAHLPMKYQEVLILKYYEEKSYEEIADILKKPAGTIATLLNRAKKQLTHEFTSLGYTHAYGNE